jgi:hypothetical protein
MLISFRFGEREFSAMTEHWRNEEGTGKLTSRVFPAQSWDVRYSITLSVGFSLNPSDPLRQTKVDDVVHRIESGDGIEIPLGEYYLVRSAEGPNWPVRLRRTLSGWTVLPPDRA